MEGPPTIVATEYNPTSGPSGVYSGGKSTNENKDVHFGSQAPQMTGPTMPVASYHPDQRPPTYTAPVMQTTFPDQPYPFAYNPVSLPLLQGRRDADSSCSKMIPIRRIPLLCRTVSLDLSWLAIDSRADLKNDLHGLILPHRRLVEVIVVEFLLGWRLPQLVLWYLSVPVLICLYKMMML